MRFLLFLILLLPSIVFSDNAKNIPPVKNVDNAEDVTRELRRVYENVLPSSGGDNLFYRDIKNEYIGIGTTTPTVKLDVIGQVKSSGGYYVGSGYVAARAFVEFTDGGAVTVNKSFNVTSVTRNGAGDYTINFTSAMPDANYAAMGSGRFGAGTSFFTMEQHDAPTRSTTQLRVYTLNSAGTPTNAVVCSYVFFD